MNEEKYIRTRARLLPLGTCYMNRAWQEIGMAEVVVTRMHTTGNYTAGVYLVDTFAKGVKDSFYMFNQSEGEFRDFLHRMEQHSAEREDAFEETDYAQCHNLVYGSVAFAEDWGFNPCKEFALTQYILEDDTDDIERIEFEFGKDGKPLIIQGPYD
jgi:hypothetical protein